MTVVVPRMEQSGRTISQFELVSEKPRRRDDIVRLITAPHGQRFEDEALEIARLIEEKLAREAKEVGDTAAEEIGRRISFVRHRFSRRLLQYEKGDKWYSRLDNVLNLASVAAGAAAALAGGLHARAWLLIVLGSVVAVLQTFSQWIKPSQRATRRGHAAARLRDKGWDFVLSQDRYRGKELPAAWPIFYAEVNKVAQQEEAVEDQELNAAAHLVVKS